MKEHYSVAGIEFSIETGARKKETPMPQLTPFRCEPRDCEFAIRENMAMELREDGNIVAQTTATQDDQTVTIEFRAYDGGIQEVHRDKKGDWTFAMQSTPDYRETEMRLNWMCLFSYPVFMSNAISAIYDRFAARHNSIHIHASAVECDGKGYVFLGKSGRGKSTHSRMWLENIEGTELINDDGPVITTSNDEIRVWGTPWSGGTECYRNTSAEVGAIVQIHQSATNRIERASTLRAMSIIVPCLFGHMKWDAEIHESIMKAVTAIIERVPVYDLWCTPTREAALLCHETIAQR